MVVGLNINEDRLKQVAECLGCPHGEWPLNYLGLPLGGNPNSDVFWEPVIERVSKRLEGWYKSCLSRGGRLVLLQSVLGSIPIYYLSLFKVPVKIALILEKLMRNFLWKGCDDSSGCNLVKWEIVSRAKLYGGLGVGNIMQRNIALLGKWLWRFPQEADSLWHKIIDSKYGIHSNGWDSNMELKCTLRAPWKSIIKGWSSFIQNTKVSVGNGSRTSFWWDNWLEDISMKVMFPRLYRISLNKNAKVCELISGRSESSYTWDLCFSRNLNDWEIEDLGILLQKLHGFRDIGESADKRVWIGDQSGLFSCKSFFEFLCHSPSSLKSIHHNFIWKGKVPTKVKVFAWLAILNKVSTNDNLQARNPHIFLSPSWCILCKKAGENLDHILLHCDFSRQIWNKIAMLFNMCGAISRNWAEFVVIQWTFKKNNSIVQRLWRITLLALAWHLWLERNKRIFDDKSCSSEDLWCKIKHTVGIWARASSILSNSEWHLFDLDSHSFLDSISL